MKPEEKKIEIRFKLDKLREMCQCPQMFRLYLGNYFSELRNEVELELTEKEMNEKEIKKKQKLNELWIEIVDKINEFERECYKCFKFDDEKLISFYV